MRLSAASGADIGWVFDVEGEEGFRIREEKVIGEPAEHRGIVRRRQAPSRAVKPATALCPWHRGLYLTNHH